MGQAEKIDNLSSDLGGEIQKLENILTSIGSNWKGPASTAYQKHLSLLISDLRKTKRSMSDVASTIHDVATKIQREDERQAELAAQLAGANNGKKENMF